MAESVSVPLVVLKGMWQKAEQLLASSTSISAAPGHPPNSRMVESRSGKRPHLVVSGKGGQFKCDEDCLNFKSMGICCHTIAVAHKNNSLQQFISWFTQSKRRPSFTKVAVHGMPGGRGKKGSQAPRKRKKQEECVNRINRISADQTDNYNSTSTFNIQASTYSPYNYMPWHVPTCPLQLHGHHHHLLLTGHQTTTCQCPSHQHHYTHKWSLRKVILLTCASYRGT